MGTTQLHRELRPDGEPSGTRLVSVLVLGGTSQVSQNSVPAPDHAQKLTEVLHAMRTYST